MSRVDADLFIFRNVISVISVIPTVHIPVMISIMYHKMIIMLGDIVTYHLMISIKT